MRLSLSTLRPSLLAAFVSLGLLTTGCLACDDVAITSVVLSVTDDEGVLIAGASASYSVDGGTDMECEALEDGSIWCGVEVEGNFTITAQAPGYQSASAMVTVDADQCHVTTEEVDLVLQAAP